MLHGKDDRFGFPPTQIVEKHHGWNMGYGFLNDPRRFPDHRCVGVVLPYYDHLMVNGFRYNKVAVERSGNNELTQGRQKMIRALFEITFTALPPAA